MTRINHSIISVEKQLRRLDMLLKVLSVAKRKKVNRETKSVAKRKK